jgi:uncharacterized NAD(P)/FAD-binding protein YdhS
VRRLRICIVGGGFSGVTTAVRLLDGAQSPLHLTLIDRSSPVGRGVAYGVESTSLLLNVPSARMGAMVEDEEQFYHFARTRDRRVSPADFLSRSMYGEYLGELLSAAARRGSGAGHELNVLTDAAMAIEMDSDSRFHISLASSSPLASFDAVVVATGNLAPVVPAPVGNDLSSHSRFIADPWAPQALRKVDSRQPALLIGTGLTAVDVALSIAQEHGEVPIVAISRRGQLPQPHRPHGHPPSYGHFPPDLVACPPTIGDYVSAVRKHVRALQKDGIDWREAIGSLRPLTPKLWQGLPQVERERFLRHVQPFWDTHRHRISSQVFARIEDLRQRGILDVRAARLAGYRIESDHVLASIRDRGKGHTREAAFGTIINCTGPAADVKKQMSAFLQSLVSGGFAEVDSLGLGLRVASNGSLIRRNGQAQDNLKLVGPLLKGEYWEATAVPELRVHAAKTAEALLTHLQRVS